MARPPLTPEPNQRRQVILLAKFGLHRRQIGEILDLDPRTLAKHFSDELRQGEEQAAAGRLTETLDLIAQAAGVVHPAVQRDASAGSSLRAGKPRRRALKENDSAREI